MYLPYLHLNINNLTNSRLLKKTFIALSEFPNLKIKIKEKEDRKQEMRARVASILPDFNYMPSNDIL